MTTIEIQIQDQFIRRMGMKAIKDRLQEDIEYLYYENLGKEIMEKIVVSGIDNEKELEQAREIAWNEYKSKFLKGIIL